MVILAAFGNDGQRLLAAGLTRSLVFNHAELSKAYSSKLSSASSRKNA